MIIPILPKTVLPHSTKFWNKCCTQRSTITMSKETLSIFSLILSVTTLNPMSSFIGQNLARGGQLGKCPNMCFSCTQKPVIHCLLFWLDYFCFISKLVLRVTRGCAWIHVGHFVCKLAGLQAHNDYQNPNRVTHGITACVSLHPQVLNHSTLFFCNDICLLQEFRTTRNHVIWCREWSDLAHGWLKSRVHAATD